MAAQLRVHSLLESSDSGRTLLLAQYSDSEELVVFKGTQRSLLSQPAEALKVLRERHALLSVSRVPHPFIVGSFGGRCGETSIYEALEYVSGGSGGSNGTEAHPSGSKVPPLRKYW